MIYHSKAWVGFHVRSIDKDFKARYWSNIATFSSAFDAAVRSNGSHHATKLDLLDYSVSLPSYDSSRIRILRTLRIVKDHDF